MLRPIDVVIRWLAAFNAPISRWGRVLAAVLLALMLAVALAQIVSRATLDYTLDWAEDVARMSLVWSVLLTAPIAYRAGQHVAIGVFVESLPPRLIYAVALLINLLIGWICLALLGESGAMLNRGMAITAASLPIQMVWVYVIVPVSLSLLTLVAVEMSLRLLRSLLAKDYSLRLAGVVPIVETESP